MTEAPVSLIPSVLLSFAISQAEGAVGREEPRGVHG